MSTFSWLLISDLHLKSTQSKWNQSVVLRDMVRDIEKRKVDFQNISFMIVSGDLAYGGKPEEYLLVETFLDDLIGVLGLSRSDVFMVPGNHDIDRDVSELTFHGTRVEFENAENVEKYLANKNELAILVKRLSAYYEFENEYSKDIIRQTTEDGLAYFSQKFIGDVPIGIVALNSALACGNEADERCIIVGDRPIIDICEVIRKNDVRLIIGVLHHPPNWLREFDQCTFDERFLPMCDVLHRGHLHEPEVKLLYTASSEPCLAIAAGAGYAYRQFKNSYSIISFNPSESECTAVYFEYNSHSGTFSEKTTEIKSLRLRGTIPGGAPEVCAAIRELGGTADKFAPYLAALLLEKITEVPIPMNGQVFFAASNVIDSTQDEDYAKVLKNFLNVRNSLLAYSTDTPLKDRIFACENPILTFSDQIDSFSNIDRKFSCDINRRIENASEFCDLALQPSENTFIAAMKQFAEESDWDGLEIIAQRYITSDLPEVKHSAQQHLCLALANSEDMQKLNDSVNIAEELVLLADAVVDDFYLCFSINRSQGNVQRAEELILKALELFGILPAAFVSAATNFSQETGNKNLMELLGQRNGAQNE